ncbi:hypothetical protein Taro_050925 [Colocasia esculenta]|uniref:Late embryogenesis abundant protein LEA-2 subgroup domain-containing protein n=1 Tax=Colocasia esculenta TaxID=4460 RepID=A0A843XEM5_COLES|nr:hypothetical protein [Colocasia esculenta]
MSVKKDGGQEHHHHRHHKFYRHLFACLLAFVVLVLFIILVIYLVLRPTKPRFLLQDASVIVFNLSGTPPAAAFVTTTMQVTLTTRNPNDHIGIYYDKLDVYAAYKYQQVTLATAIPPTYQGHNDVVVWSPFLYGVNVPIAPYLALGVAQDQNAGLMLLYVKVRGRLRWKVGTWTSGHYHISVSCPALLGFRGQGGGYAGGGYSPVIRFQQGSTCTVDV